MYREFSEVEKLWDLLIKTGVATEEELTQETRIHGYNKETLEDMLYYKTSWRDYQQANEALEAGEFYSNM